MKQRSTDRARPDHQGIKPVLAMALAMALAASACGGSAHGSSSTTGASAASATAAAASSTELPAVKPLGQGPVRVRGRALETDFDGNGSYEPFQVRGVAYGISAIGVGLSEPVPHMDAYVDRSMTLLKAMHSNAIRTYDDPGEMVLDKAAAAGIKVVVGYWVPLDMDLSLPGNRNSILNGFIQMVTARKDDPAVLMWNIGNEQNYSNGKDQNWFSLVQEMAIAAYQIEGPDYHPVCASNGGFAGIGNAAIGADDASLSYMDLWCSNAYEVDFGPPLAAHSAVTTKPILITEYGIDAMDNRTGREYQDVQASVDLANWNQLVAAGYVCVGGTVFVITDGWWKDNWWAGGDPASHDMGGYATTAHPDGFSNEEWWGLIALAPDSNGDGLDEWLPRKAYYAFQTAWAT